MRYASFDVTMSGRVLLPLRKRRGTGSGSGICDGVVYYGGLSDEQLYTAFDKLLLSDHVQE